MNDPISSYIIIYIYIYIIYRFYQILPIKKAVLSVDQLGTRTTATSFRSVDAVAAGVAPA